jgi:hypothetical protein
MCKTLGRIRIRFGIGIKIESRIRIWMMPIHNTASQRDSLSSTEKEDYLYEREKAGSCGACFVGGGW